MASLLSTTCMDDPVGGADHMPGLLVTGPLVAVWRVGGGWFRQSLQVLHQSVGISAEVGRERGEQTQRATRGEDLARSVWCLPLSPR